MAASAEDSIRYASDSGFPLQIAVQHAIESTQRQTGWGVQYVEHGWVHPDQDQRGFIDLVLYRGGHRFVVECKRQRDATWVFMHYSGQGSNRRHFTPWVTEAQGESIVFHGWAHAPLDPACPEATFCAIRGQTSSDRNTLLERTGAELILATEALARSERDFRYPDRPSANFYYPLLVTTAALKFANFDPATVALEDGEIQAASVVDVPFVRLRKQLATRFKALSSTDLIRGGDPSYMMENSVFVVQATKLVEFLSEFERPTSYSHEA